MTARSSTAFLSPSVISSCEEAEVRALADLSARLGDDPLLVQAATGNTSVKVSGALWIKASGKWLADARRQEIFTRIDHTQLDGLHDTASGALLQPSIETAMHATLPHKVVVHVHSVNATAWAVRRDGREQLQSRLDGLPWQWIPYVASGLPLAREIASALRRSPGASTFVLANHGLVICGPSCQDAEALLREVERRLTICPRRSADPDCASLERLASAVHWRLPGLNRLHSLATDRFAQSILSGGVLYPCQALFLTPSLHALQPDACVAHAAASYQEEYGIRPPFLVIRDRGVLISDNIAPAEYALLAGLLEVVRRLDGSAPIRYLTQAEVIALRNADTYRYRSELSDAADCG